MVPAFINWQTLVLAIILIPILGSFTVPLVAFLNRRDVYHAWTVGQWGLIRPPRN